MKTKFNLYMKVGALIIIAIVVMMGVYVMITLIANYHGSTTLLKQFTDTSSIRLSNNLSPPMWQFNTEVIDNILRQEVLHQDVIAIILKDENGKVYRKNVDIEYTYLSHDESEIAKVSFYSVTHPIKYERNYLGTVTVYVTFNNIKKILFQEVMRRIGIALVIMIIVLLTLYLGLKIVILDPLFSLIYYMDDFGAMNFSVRSHIKTGDEIGFLSTRFNSMASAIERYSQELMSQIFTDSLTRLPNRNQLLSDLEGSKYTNPILFIINIDGFQEINDFYGNEIGDYILIETASRLSKTPLDCPFHFYKLHSDEYAFLIEGETDYDNEKAAANIIKDYILKQIMETPITIDDLNLYMRITVGVADTQTVQCKKHTDLLMHANMALKKAKKMKRQFLIYNDSFQLKKQYEENIIMANLLKWATKHEQIVPFYQPIINNKTGQIEKYECLCRLIKEDGTVVSPFFFLDVAKNTGYYAQITRQMITKSLMLFENNEYEFSINLSMTDICDAETIKFINNILNQNKHIAKRLVFEIIESEGIENYDEVKEFIEIMKNLGCKIAIDDFGSGYSNFENIIKLNIDYLKIDATLIKSLDTNRELQILTKTIVNFSKELGIKTIAEYVHSQQVFNKVKELHVDFSQGFFLGQPDKTLV